MWMRREGTRGRPPDGDAAATTHAEANPGRRPHVEPTDRARALGLARGSRPDAALLRSLRPRLGRAYRRRIGGAPRSTGGRAPVREARSRAGARRGHRDGRGGAALGARVSAGKRSRGRHLGGDDSRRPEEGRPRPFREGRLPGLRRRRAPLWRRLLRPRHAPQHAAVHRRGGPSSAPWGSRRRGLELGGANALLHPRAVLEWSFAKRGIEPAAAGEAVSGTYWVGRKSRQG